jgi:hypothetical protein
MQAPPGEIASRSSVRLFPGQCGSGLKTKQPGILKLGKNYPTKIFFCSMNYRALHVGHVSMQAGLFVTKEGDHSFFLATDRTMSYESNHVRGEALVTQDIENTSILMRGSPSRLTKHPLPCSRRNRGHVKDSPLQRYRRRTHVTLPQRQRTREES